MRFTDDFSSSSPNCAIDSFPLQPIVTFCTSSPRQRSLDKKSASVKLRECLESLVTCTGGAWRRRTKKEASTEGDVLMSTTDHFEEHVFKTSESQRNIMFLHNRSVCCNSINFAMGEKSRVSKQTGFSRSSRQGLATVSVYQPKTCSPRHHHWKLSLMWSSHSAQARRVSIRGIWHVGRWTHSKTRTHNILWEEGQQHMMKRTRKRTTTCALSKFRGQKLFTNPGCRRWTSMMEERGGGQVSISLTVFSKSFVRVVRLWGNLVQREVFFASVTGAFSFPCHR